LMPKVSKSDSNFWGLTSSPDPPEGPSVE